MGFLYKFKLDGLEASKFENKIDSIEFYTNQSIHVYAFTGTGSEIKRDTLANYNIHLFFGSPGGGRAGLQTCPEIFIKVNFSQNISDKKYSYFKLVPIYFDKSNIEDPIYNLGTINIYKMILADDIINVKADGRSKIVAPPEYKIRPIHNLIKFLGNNAATPLPHNQIPSAQHRCTKRIARLF